MQRWLVENAIIWLWQVIALQSNDLLFMKRFMLAHLMSRKGISGGIKP